MTKLQANSIFAGGQKAILIFNSEEQAMITFTKQVMLPGVLFVRWCVWIAQQVTNIFFIKFWKRLASQNRAKMCYYQHGMWKLSKVIFT